MNDDERRRLIEHALGRALTKGQHGVLSETVPYAKWVDGHDESFEDVAQLAVDMFGEFGGVELDIGRGSESSQERPGGGDGRAAGDLDLADDALCRLVARIAAKDQTVQGFRASILWSGPAAVPEPCRLLTFEELANWLPRAVNLLAKGSYGATADPGRLGPPVVQQTAHTVSTIASEAAGGSERAMEALRFLHQTDLLPRELMPFPRGMEELDQKLLCYENAERKKRFVVCEEGSWLLVKTNALGRFLASAYWWTCPQAISFLFTGHIPQVQRFDIAFSRNARVPALSRIRLLVDPSLDPNEVAALYRAQRTRLKQRFGKLTEKHLRLALFAFDRDEDDSIAWPAAMLEWNELDQVSERGWRYEKSFIFRRDAEAAYKRILFPKLAGPRKQEADDE